MPESLVNEADFERRFVEPVCSMTLNRIRPEMEVAVHPWGDKTKARKWRESKLWGATRAWGMQHAFDLVARDASRHETLAVEVKLANVRGARLPTGEFQRMMGQCILARLQHDAVIGVFGHRGELPERWQSETRRAASELAQHGIWVVVRQVG